uniref:Calmodulin n=1 Tax=Chlamydomonas euryale TaxID=1486919 RepID=A0A6U2JVD1_9CHLO
MAFDQPPAPVGPSIIQPPGHPALAPFPAAPLPLLHQPATAAAAVVDNDAAASSQAVQSTPQPPGGAPPPFRRSSSRPSPPAASANGTEPQAAADMTRAGNASPGLGPMPPPAMSPPPFKRPSPRTSIGDAPAASPAVPGTAMHSAAATGMSPRTAVSAAPHAAAPLPSAAENPALAALRDIQAMPPPSAAPPPALQRPPPDLSPPFEGFSGHPLLSPPLLLRCQATAFDAPLASGDLGQIEKLVVTSAEGAAEPWYLEKVEIRLMGSDPPLAWEAHYRGWIHPAAPPLEDRQAALLQDVEGGGSQAETEDPDRQNGNTFWMDPLKQAVQKVELQPDPLAWEEWDMQTTASGRVVTSYYNRNKREWHWEAPYATPQPTRPGSVPVGRPVNPYAPGSSKEWLFGTPIGQPRLSLRYVDELPEVADRIRPHYGLGKHGELGLPGASVSVCGVRPGHAVALHGRGGFRAARPAQLQEQWAAYSAQGEAWQPVGMPGVMEATAVSYDLQAASAARGEQYAWFQSTVALDDSCKLLVAPVRFSLLLDGHVAWRSNWMDGPQQVEVCSASVAGCLKLSLVVETEFSADARAVWMDPHLLMAPLPPNSRAGLAGSPGQLAGAPGPGRVQTVVQSNGEISFLLPAAESAETHAGSGSNMATYCISVFTANENGAETGGQVYLRLKGRKGGSVVTTKWLLLNHKRKLERGSKTDFIVELKDMEVVEELEMEHKPAAVAINQDWCLQHVEVTHETRSVTAYFHAGGWFHALVTKQLQAARPPDPMSPASVSNPDSPFAALTAAVSRTTKATGAPSKLLLRLFAADTADMFKVVLHILSNGPGRGMGMDAAMQMWFTGIATDGSYLQHPWNMPERSVKSQTTTLLFKGPPPSALSPLGGLGELVQVQLSSGAQSQLASRLQCVEVVRLADGKHFLCLGKDAQVLPSEGASALAMPVTQVPHLIVSTLTGRDPDAATDARVYLDLVGDSGQLQDLFLRDTGDTFNAGQEDSFFFANPGIGALTCAVISHDDSGTSPNWLLERLEVTDTGSGRTYAFPCGKWVGLDKGGADSALQRTLYPAQDTGGGGQGGGEDGSSAAKLVHYHMMVSSVDRSADARLWHAAESVVMAGELHGLVAHTDVVILDTGRRKLNLQVDSAYVQHVQWSAAMSGVPPPQGSQGYEVECTYEAVHEGRGGWAGASAPREASLVMHGRAGSSNSLRLGAANSGGMGTRPFSAADQADTFMVESPPLGGLLRLDLKQANFDASWGVRLARVTVRDLQSAELSEFVPPGGAWLGASPELGASSVQGQTLRLLPAGLCIATFTAKSIGALRTVHLRHDSPGAFAGWPVTGVEVFLSEAGATGRPPPAVAAVSPRDGLVSEAGGLPQLYTCQPGAAEPAAWPSDERQYIRHFITMDAVQFGEKVPKYFLPPSITTSAYGQPPLPQDPLELSAQGITPGLVATDPRKAAMAAFIPSAGDEKLAVLDPAKAAALAEEYRAEEAAFRNGKSDVFALLRARLRSAPTLTQMAYEYYDDDKDGRIVGDQVIKVLQHAVGSGSNVQPPLALPPPLIAHFELMLSLGNGGAPMGQKEFVRQLKLCHEAWKRSASMHRLQVAGGGRLHIDADLAGAEHALCVLAGKLVDPKGSEVLGQAFAKLDTDGSGYLDGPELVAALRIVEPKLTTEELRVLLAYLQIFGDTDADGCITSAELCASLAPFVQGPPEQELERATQEYAAGELSIFTLVKRVLELQPALLPSLMVQLGGRPLASGTAAAPATGTSAAAASEAAAAATGTSAATPERAEAAVPGSKLHEVLTGLLTGVRVRPEHVLFFVNMMLLDGGAARSVSAAQFTDAVESCVDANKRAGGMYRMVQAAKAAGEQVCLDPDLGGTELVFTQLAQVYAGPDADRAKAAFKAADADSSGFLDFRELCAVVKRVKQDVTDDELRLLLSYISDFADVEKDFKTSQGELVGILRPFMPRAEGASMEGPSDEAAAAAGRSLQAPSQGQHAADRVPAASPLQPMRSLARPDAAAPPLAGPSKLEQLPGIGGQQASPQPVPSLAEQASPQPMPPMAGQVAAGNTSTVPGRQAALSSTPPLAGQQPATHESPSAVPGRAGGPASSLLPAVAGQQARTPGGLPPVTGQAPAPSSLVPALGPPTQAAGSPLVAPGQLSAAAPAVPSAVKGPQQSVSPPGKAAADDLDAEAAALGL